MLLRGFFLSIVCKVIDMLLLELLVLVILFINYEMFSFKDC